MARPRADDPRHRIGPKAELIRSLCPQRPLVFSRRYADIVYTAGHAVGVCAMAFQQNGHDDKLCRHRPRRSVRHAEHRTRGRRQYCHCQPRSNDAGAARGAFHTVFSHPDLYKT